MIANSSNIETALIGLLLADATLRALMPDGVFFGVAPPNAKRFIVVDLIDPSDVGTFDNGRAVEDNGYQVKASGLSTAMSESDVDAAAYRIDQLLGDQPLDIVGYAGGTVYRDPDASRIRDPEPTAPDASIVWFHAGGQYRVHAAALDLTTKG